MHFNSDIVTLAQKNESFRQEVVTGTYSQVVLMSIPPGGEIGEETHHNVDQVLVFVAGEGEAILHGEHHPVATNSLCFVPAGTKHNFINTGTRDLKLYTVYAPQSMRRVPFTRQKPTPTLLSTHESCFSSICVA